MKHFPSFLSLIVGFPHYPLRALSLYIDNRFLIPVGIVMGAFVVCWLPFFIWMPLTALLELDTPDGVYSAILWIGYGNSAVNPVIYGVFSKEIREAIADEFARAKECCRKAGTVE